MSATSLRRAAWAGLQDSMPRAALLSIHARVEKATPSSWEHPSLAQVWGPRFSAYVVPARDHAIFTLGRLPEGESGRSAKDLAARLHTSLKGRRLGHTEAVRPLGLRHPNQIRYATTTGRVLIPAPKISPQSARLELARRFLHVFGPGTSGSFAEWAGIDPARGRAIFDALARSLLPVRTPIGDAWMLNSDERAVRAKSGQPALARLIPSGDTFFLLQGADRALLVPDAKRRGTLWTSRVWPGAVLVAGEIAGIWRRDAANVTIETWRRLSRAERDAVEAEARSMPLPDVAGRIRVSWSA